MSRSTPTTRKTTCWHYRCEQPRDNVHLRRLRQSHSDRRSLRPSSEAIWYDAANNLTSKTDRKSQTIQYVYDALNRLTQKTYPDSTSAAYVYDLAGKISQVTDPTGTYGFSYDNMGRLTGTTTQYSFLSGELPNSYGYDAASNRKCFTAPDASTNTYTYDTLNRLNTLVNSWARLVWVQL